LYASRQTFRRLRVDVSLTYDTAKGRLDMPARAAEPIVEIEMPESGVKVVAPQKVHHTAAQPDALRIGGWSAESSGGFGEILDLAGAIF
jgi:hypothetical protein